MPEQPAASGPKPPVRCQRSPPARPSTSSVASSFQSPTLLYVIVRSIVRRAWLDASNRFPLSSNIPEYTIILNCTPAANPRFHHYRPIPLPKTIGNYDSGPPHEAWEHPLFLE